MFGLLLTIHIIVCIALIVIVLLQAGKGADIGATFGTGASQSLFGASGGSNFLGKLTASAAVIFMLTSLSLAYLSGKPSTSSVMRNVAPAAKSNKQQPVPAPQTPATAPVAPSQDTKK